MLRAKLEAAEARLARERELREQEREERERERLVRDQEREDHGETVRDLRKRLDRAEERVLALSAQPTPQVAPEPPAVVEELRRQLAASEAHVRALVTAAPPAPQAAQERPGEAPAVVTPAGVVRGLLERFLRR